MRLSKIKGKPQIPQKPVYRLTLYKMTLYKVSLYKMSLDKVNLLTEGLTSISLLSLMALLFSLGCASSPSSSNRPTLTDSPATVGANSALGSLNQDLAAGLSATGDQTANSNDPQTLIHSELAREKAKNLAADSENHSLQWPVDSARLSRGFLPKKRKPHLGIDLAGPKNSPIYAAHDGVVIYVGRRFKGYGRMLMIESESKNPVDHENSDEGFATLYAHLNKFLVKQGRRVKKGDLIGLMGRSGHATGNHLHFELRTIRGPVDPIQYLPFVPKAVVSK